MAFDTSWKVPCPSVSFIRGDISCPGSSTGIINVDIYPLSLFPNDLLNMHELYILDIP